MTTIAKASPDRLLFTTVIGLTVLVAFAGFAPSYYLKAWFGTPPLTLLVHVHAVLFSAWLGLLLVQSALIRGRRFVTHASLGRWAVAVVVLMVATGFMVVLMKPRPTEAARAFIFTPLLSLMLFPIMVAAAIRYRGDPATHKRLMLLATCLFMGAPMTRLMAMADIRPGPYLHHALTYVLVLLPIAFYDLWRTRRLPPATLWGGLVLLARHPLHEMIAWTPTWQRIAAAITP